MVHARRLGPALPRSRRTALLLDRELQGAVHGPFGPVWRLMIVSSLSFQAGDCSLSENTWRRRVPRFRKAGRASRSDPAVAVLEAALLVHQPAVLDQAL